MKFSTLFHQFLFALMLSIPATVFAHHGWSWTTGGNIQVTGAILEARLGNPHGVLLVGVNDERWTAEVGQPWRNARAGLEDGDLAPGTEVKLEGEPSADIEQKRIKVERLWIGGNRYELYPERD